MHHPGWSSNDLVVHWQARERSMDAYKNLYPLIKQMLLIVSRPIRLLECLVSSHAAQHALCLVDSTRQISVYSRKRSEWWGWGGMIYKDFVSFGDVIREFSFSCAVQISVGLGSDLPLCLCVCLSLSTPPPFLSLSLPPPPPPISPHLFLPPPPSFSQTVMEACDPCTHRSSTQRNSTCCWRRLRVRPSWLWSKRSPNTSFPNWGSTETPWLVCT